MGRFILLAAASLALGACDWVKSSRGCSQGPGLSRQAFLGRDLPAQTLALTFDGGPGDATLELADYLAVENVPAGFFVKGMEAITRKAALAHLKGRGHLVANGGFTGKDLLTVPDPILDVTRSDALITRYVSGNVFMLRFPSDRFDDGLIASLNDAGLRKYVGPIAADIDAPVDECGANRISASDCAQAYLRDIRQRGQGIVRLREADADIMTIVKTLVPTLKDEGFSFVRMDEVPGIRLALEAAGAQPGTVSGPEGCNDYE